MNMIPECNPFLNPESSSDERVKCPYCNVAVFPENLRNHMLNNQVCREKQKFADGLLIDDQVPVLYNGKVACPYCGSLVYAGRLHHHMNSSLSCRQARSGK